MLQSGEELLDRYVIKQPLGRGGFGSVSLAEDKRLRRLVAIKELDVSRVPPEDHDEAALLFEREALMLAQLDHPGLTHIWDYFQHDGRVFLVMEYVRGGTLRDLVLRYGRLPEAFVRDCALQLCDVLAYLHNRTPPIIFRDLKPSNIMLAEQADQPGQPHAPLHLSQVKLIDFGIARFFKPDQTSDTMIIGTPGYAPPEQYGQGQTDERSDIYSLGATLHHLLSGQSPAGVLLPPLAGVSPAFTAIIERATTVEPAGRYTRIADMRADLLAMANTVPLDQPAPNTPVVARSTPRTAPQPKSQPAPRAAVPPAPAPSKGGSAGMAVVALVLVFAVAGVVAFWLFNQRTPTTAAVEQRPTVTVAAEEVLVPTQAPKVAGDWNLPGVGGRIAYGARSDRLAYTVVVATLDGAQPKALSGTGNEYSPAWSPDGQYIAFSRVVVAGRQSAIVVEDANGGNQRQIVPPGSYARYPTWSPDGQEIAFGVGPDRNGPFRLAIINLVSNEIRYPGPQNVAWMSWSSAGLVYAARPQSGAAQDLFVLNSDGSGRNLTNTPDQEEDFPAWSPDTKSLAFVASPAGNAGLAKRQIYRSNADGSGRTAITATAGPSTNPVWSPDGGWIAYLTKATGQGWQVWAHHTADGQHQQLSSDAQDKFFLSWGK